MLSLGCPRGRLFDNVRAVRLYLHTASATADAVHGRLGKVLSRSESIQQCILPSCASRRTMFGASERSVSCVLVKDNLPPSRSMTARTWYLLPRHEMMVLPPLESIAQVLLSSSRAPKEQHGPQQKSPSLLYLYALLDLFCLCTSANLPPTRAMSASPSDPTQRARKRANGGPSHAGQYAPLSDGAAAAGSQPAAPAPLAGKIRLFVTLGLLLLTFSSLSAGRLREILAGKTPWSQAPPPPVTHASSSLSSSPAAGTPAPGGVPASEDGLPSLHRRVVAIADIHGSLSNLLTILSMSHLITQSSTSGSSATSEPSVVWSPLGADDVLVSTGDNVDRGDDTIQIYELWESLRGQAGEERVRTCLGNHEVMNALGDWRYVTPGDIKSFGGEKARRHAMSSQGWVGRNWLDHYNLSYSIDLLDRTKVHDLQSSSSSSSSALVRGKGIPPLPSSYAPPRTNFVHGGLHPSFTSRHTLTELNAISHSFLTKALDAAAQGIELRGYLPPGTTDEEMAMWGEKGPYWYRGYSYEKEVDACRIAKEAMEGLREGVGQIVMGQ